MLVLMYFYFNDVSIISNNYINLIPIKVTILCNERYRDLSP